jgi:hypothetical protein
MAIVDNSTTGATSGWDQLKDLFKRSGLEDLADVLTSAIQDYGTDNDALILAKVREAPQYMERFKGNYDRLAAGKNWLSEGTYLQQENMYAEILGAHQAGNLAKRENYAKFIAGDVSINELSNRFDAAYNRVTKAVNSDDKPLLDELRRLYPGVTDSELAQTLLLGTEGSDFLRTKINVAEINAAQTETGVKSVLGADFLESQGIDRNKARQGLAKTGIEAQGFDVAAKAFGQDPEEIRKQLERENLLGTAGAGTRKLASQTRANMSSIAGTAGGSLKTTKAGQI